MTERKRQNSQSSPVEPHEIEMAFNTILRNYPNSDARIGRPPKRVQKLLDIFKKNENEGVTLEELAEVFSDAKNARKRASSAVTWINNFFDDMGLDLELKSQIVYKVQRKTNSGSSE